MEAPYHTFTTGAGVVTCNSHAAAYAITGYASQWFKVEHPVHFWSATINNVKATGKVTAEMKISRYLREIRTINKLGISQQVTISPPSINRSGARITMDANTNTIYWALNKISGVGDSASSAIITERIKGGKFYSFEEMLKRIPKSILKKNVIEAMILSGSFDEFGDISEPKDRAQLIRDFCRETGNKESDYPYLNNEPSWWEFQQVNYCGLVS